MNKLFQHALVHFGITGAAFLLWAISGQGWFASIMAVVAGAAGSLLLHEWLHFAGARLAGAQYQIPGNSGLFIFEFDYESNNLRQFMLMSWAGQAGSWLLVALLMLVLPMQQPTSVLLVAGALGNAVFGSAIEWPVIFRARHSGDPFGELSKIGVKTLVGSFLSGVLAAVLFSLALY